MVKPMTYQISLFLDSLSRLAPRANPRATASAGRPNDVRGWWQFSHAVLQLNYAVLQSESGLFYSTLGDPFSPRRSSDQLNYAVLEPRRTSAATPYFSHKAINVMTNATFAQNLQPGLESIMPLFVFRKVDIQASKTEISLVEQEKGDFRLGGVDLDLVSYEHRHLLRGACREGLGEGVVRLDHRLVALSISGADK
ncbi:hypothetical protein Bbelb_338080 [Branchiostoma belcheri]|nr:hypothetical protein Bbelb_338080 [Branchiostoma belcheri]